jgi:cytochrome c-type biogenesis protein CcmH
VSLIFWGTAIVLVALASSFLVVPAWQRRRQQGRWPVAGLIGAALIVPAAAGLYATVGHWRAVPTTAPVPPVADMASALEARLRESPEDPVGWQLLGRSYLMLGQPAAARDAFREAWSRTPQPANDLKLALAEAEALADRSALGGEAGRLVEEVLASEPHNAKALWYGGLVALDRGNAELARERWSRLLALNPPAQVATILNEQLAALGGVASESSTHTGAATSSTGVAIDIRVNLADDLPRAKISPQSALFILARAPEGGPPIAVLRQPADALPGAFTLSDANAMIAGRTLGAFETVRLVARLSMSGQPAAQPGDWYGESDYRPGVDPPEVELTIDRIQE